MTTDELRRGTEGLDEAIQRTAAGWSEQEALKALDEALDRLHSVEEFHKKRLEPDRYFAARDKSEAGRVLAGLMYVRGLTHHQLATTSDLVDAFSDTFTVTFGALQWRPFGQLPLPHRREVHDRDALYQAHVQGQDVLGTLTDAKRFLVNEIATI